MKCSYLAHGKVIIIGEHAVVYGYSALAMPILALHINTSVEPADAMLLDTAQYYGRLQAAPSAYNGLKYVVQTMTEKAHSKEKLKLTYTGEIPIERGLGSSATVAFGTTKVLNQYFKLNLSDDEIMAITNQAEMINHGKASGLDAATVASNDLIFFNQKTGPKSLTAKLNATLLIMDTGDLGNTKEAVSQVRQQLEIEPKAKTRMAALGTLADETKTAWLKQDRQRVGAIFNEAESILASFKLTTKKITQLQVIAQKNGALGFKLSGSGLGGIVIALCDNPEIATNIAQASRELIANYWLEEI